jgi:NAD(P)-dependent dehydrogenase (short-subunit alcohol dehydrogenase family)
VRWRAEGLPDLTGRVAVVTGANSGIGWYTADALAGAGAQVVLACRDLVRADRAVRRIRDRHEGAAARPAGLDLSSMSSVREFAESWDGPLDILVNNAGVMAPPRRTITADGFELQFATNHLGHFVLTGLLLPALLAADRARVVTVSSIAHHGGGEDVIDGNLATAYNPQRAYSNSKLANLLFATELDRRSRLRGVNVDSVAAHPGVAATGLASDSEGMGANRVVRVAAPIVLRLTTQSARAGAHAVRYAATEAEPGSYTGPQRFGETRGRIGPARRSPLAQDDRLARRLWQVSEELTGLQYRWPARDSAAHHRADPA